jgi:integrase
LTEQLSLDLFGRLERLTVSGAIVIYWKLEGQFLKGHSVRTDLERFKRFGIGDLYLDEVGPHDVKAYRAHRKIDHPSIRESTLNKEQNRIVRLMNAFYEWHRQGKVGGYDFSNVVLRPENPLENLPREDETRYQRNVVLTPEQFSRWLDFAHPETRKIATLAVLTLLRRGDLSVLTPDNLNRALDVVSGTQRKTGHPYHVPATITVRVLFAKATTEYVVDFSNHRKRWRRACEDSGIWFQLRDLRRTGATHLLLEGIDIVTVQRYLGHKNIGMTMAYLNPPQMVSREAAKRLERKFVTRVEIPAYGFQEN